MSNAEDIRFGRVAVKLNLVTPEQVERALAAQNAADAQGQAHRPLGDWLVEVGLITPAQVARVLEEQRNLAQPKTLGTYQLLHKLGEGGMGAVFKARHAQTGQEVALKILKKNIQSDQSFLGRFKREAATGLKLEHAHILRTLDVGEAQGVHFMALELVEGGDLDRRLPRGGYMPEAEALKIVHAVALALEYASAQGLVHRDIKPANIMFTKDGTVKLSDFGLVKFTDPETSHLTQTGMLVGTPHYISPEQAQAERDIDVRADIYSLGATLYRIVTGRTPFEGSSAIEVITKHLMHELQPPDEVNPELSEGCCALIEKMMAKAREDRYATTQDLLRDIEAVQRGEVPPGASLDAGRSTVQRSAKRISATVSMARTVVTRKPSVQPDQSTARKSPLAALFVGAVLALLLLAGAAYFFFFRNNGETSGATQPPPPAPPAASTLAPVIPPMPPTTPPPAQPPPRLNIEQLERAFTGLPSEDRATRLRMAEEMVRHMPANGPLALRIRNFISTMREQLKQEGVTLVELLPHIEPLRDGKHGKWVLDNGALRSDNAGTLTPPRSAKLQLPYHPPAEYDFRIVFSRLEGVDAVVQILPNAQRHFAWFMGSFSNHVYGFGMVDNNLESAATKRVDSVLSNTRRYDSIVYVRKDKVRAIVRELTEAGLPVPLYDQTFDTDYLNLSNWEGWRIPGIGSLGLATFASPTVFYEIGVTEIGAKGTLTGGE